MNILAKKQQKLGAAQLTDEEQEQQKKEFLKLYFELRNKDENGFFGRWSLKTRKRLHKFVLLVFRLKNWFSGFSWEIIKDEKTKTDRPIIYALTHIGKFDIEVSAVGLREHFYILSGDYEHLQGTVDGTFLLVNGVFYFNEWIKEDRKAVSEKMIEHLKKGGNLMYFPEGTWNLSPNLPVLPCYWGIVDVARAGNAIIVPVAVEQYGKHFKIRIGENFDMRKFGSDITEKLKAINALRDILATLKWEIWESEPQIKRREITNDEWEQYIDSRFREWPYFNLEYIDSLILKPRREERVL